MDIERLVAPAADMPPLLRWFLAVWIAMLGGCVGSFINVVVYRLPRGRSLSHPGSACPACGHPIRWHHNVPVLGWLMLQGRCYDCAERISPRYPLVEATVAMMFLALALAGPLAAGETAPALAWGLYAYRLLLLSTILSLVLIQTEDDRRERVRYWWIWFAGPWLIGLAAPLIWPSLRGTWLDEISPQRWSGAAPQLAAAEGALATAMALLLAAVAWLPSRCRSGGETNHGFRLGSLLLVSAFLGLKAVCMLAVLTAGFFLATVLAGRVLRPLGAVTWPMILFGLTLVSMIARPSPAEAVPSFLKPTTLKGLPFSLAIVCVLVFLLSLAAWALCRRENESIASELEIER